MTIVTKLPSFEPVIGLEIHVQLATRTKMFCGCANLFGAPPNTLCCPVCLGLPGALPVPNRRAVELAVRAGLAFGSEISNHTKFDRKNYFYPDLPKGYQISQYDVPVCRGGTVEWDGPQGPDRVTLVRAHLEEDAGKLVHGAPGEETRVDLNRAGVPLLEIVTEPVIRDPAHAYAFLTALKQMLVYLGVSECEMQKGSLRVDTNVSLRPAGSQAFGTRVEIKNLNSFHGVEKALHHEIRRQGEALARGEAVVQETRSFDLEKGVTAPMRSKEAAHDYRYFPEPDIPPVAIDAGWIEGIRAGLPELPRAKAARFRDVLGLSPYDAGVLTAEGEVAAFYEAVVSDLGTAQAKEAANWVIGEMLAMANAKGSPLAGLRVAPRHLADLIRAVKAGKVTRATAREALLSVAGTGQDPAARLAGGDAARIDDAAALASVADKVIAAQAQAVEDYRKGKGNALAFLVGALMKETKGRANPQLARKVLQERLGKS